MRWFVQALRKYAVFRGRAQRSEFWFFLLFYWVFLFLLAIVDGMMGWFDERREVGLLSSVYALAMIVPWFAVWFRRLHDTGRPGWWLLISIVPLLGVVALLYFAVLEGDRGDNAYGPDPRSA